MDFFENIDALLWRLAAILALVLVATLVVRLLLRDRGRSDRQQKLRVQQTLKGSGLAADKAPNGFTFGLLGGKKVYLPCDGEGHIAIFGGSGQGKTSALLIPSLRVWQGPFFCIDISGDISKNVLGEKKVLLAPDDPEHSVIYNVFDEIDRASDPDERRALLEQLTFSILPLPPKATSAERYFTETARKILLASLVAFYDKGLDFCEIMKVVFTNGPWSCFS